MYTLTNIEFIAVRVACSSTIKDKYLYSIRPSISPAIFRNSVYKYCGIYMVRQWIDLKYEYIMFLCMLQLVYLLTELSHP
jgi:hypothetical protein